MLKRTSILFIFFCVFVSLPVFASTLLLSYGFEDWGGSIGGTPTYPFTSNYAEYCTDHANNSEVVTSYTPNAEAQINPYAGSYFFIRRNSPAYDLNPSVGGISAGDVNDNAYIGLTGSQCGDSSFNLNETQMYITFRAILNSGFHNISNSGNCKWIVVGGTGGGSPTIYMHLGSDATTKYLYFYNGDEGGWLGAAVSLGSASAFDDGHTWHKFSFFIDLDNGMIYGWVDVENETLENATKTYDGSGAIGSVSALTDIHIQGNFSAGTPDSIAYHTLDALEIWDGMPDTGTIKGVTIN